MEKDQLSPTSLPPMRQGPRPLLLNLILASLIGQSSIIALPLLKSGLLPWNPSLKEEALKLQQSLPQENLGPFLQALTQVNAQRLSQFLKGLEIYRGHSYRRNMPEPKIIWQEGSARLLDFGGEGRPCLFVPSLVNKAYILDLLPERSLMRGLAQDGIRPFLLDWGSPNEEEIDFSLTDYISGYLAKALQLVVVANKGQPVPILGYCMGGLLTLAAAQLYPNMVSKVAMLATPWDFQQHREGHARILLASFPAVAHLIELLGFFPVDALQMLFLSLDPALSERKFRHLADKNPESEFVKEFVALEDWLNDGVPLSGPVAREALKGWYGRNSTVKGRWRVAGQVIDPKQVNQPALVVIPSKDRIVLPESSYPLGKLLPYSQIEELNAGHIGMVSSARGYKMLHNLLSDWIKK